LLCCSRTDRRASSITDLGLFGPESVTWRIHGDPSSLVGGLRALMVQALNPRAMRLLAQNTDLNADPWGRLSRTSQYVTETTFGDTRAAEAAGARVRNLHRRLRAVDPDTGETYSASDPDLLLWVHAVEVHSLLTAYRRYGAWLSDRDADRYVAEMTEAARLVGLHPSEVPQDLHDLRVYLRAQPLIITPEARRGLKLLLNPPLPLAAKPLWTIPSAAAVAILPRRARGAYRLPWFPPATPAVQLSVFALCRVMNVLLPGPPLMREARARARAAA
jgi:uncharacterized protein (DUF2236 family)